MKNINETIGINKSVTISIKEYKKLLLDKYKLLALTLNGVDNWKYYDESIEDFENIELKGKTINEYVNGLIDDKIEDNKNGKK